MMKEKNLELNKLIEELTFKDKKFVFVKREVLQLYEEIVQYIFSYIFIEETLTCSLYNQLRTEYYFSHVNHIPP